MPTPWPKPWPLTCQETLAFAPEASRRKRARVVSRIRISDSTGSRWRSLGLLYPSIQVQASDHKLLAAGEWLETGEWGEVKSPYDGTVVGRVAEGDAALVDRAVKAAHEAFETADFPQYERAALLDRAAALVRERRDDLALAI